MVQKKEKSFSFSREYLHVIFYVYFYLFFGILNVCVYAYDLRYDLYHSVIGNTRYFIVEIVVKLLYL